MSSLFLMHTIKKYTYYTNMEIGYGQHKWFHPFSEGLRINFSPRPTNSRSCNPFCWILLHPEERPEQMLDLRTLRKHLVCAEKVPGDESNHSRSPEELAEETVFSPVSSDWSIRPVLNIPAGCHEVLHSGRVVHDGQ